MADAPPRPARPAERPAAARLLFAHLPPAEAAARADRLLAMLADGAVDPSGLLVAGAAAALVHVPTGGVASCWPPRGAPAALPALAQAVVDRLRHDGVAMAQLMLPPEEASAAAPLEAVGFVRTTTLLTLARPAALRLGPATFAEWSIIPASDADPVVGELLLLSYDGSLDCPELNGRREAPEILAGYAAVAAERGGFCRWHRLGRRGEPAGVLLLAPGTADGVEELAYLGLSPGHRGFGGGSAATRYAVGGARGRGAEWLLTSVDARNEPARRLYARFAFRTVEEQAVWLWGAGVRPGLTS